MALYRKNYTVAVGWSVAFLLALAVIVYQFVASVKANNTQAQYLWLAFLPVALLFASVTASKTWRALISKREKIIQIYRDS